MEEWKQLTLAGNYHYSSENYESALTIYHQSLRCILDDFSNQLSRNPQGAIAAVLVSYFNLADAHAETNELDLASSQFESAFGFICQLLNSGDLGADTLDATTRGCNQLQLEWTKYIKAHAKKLSALHLQQFATAKQTFVEVLRNSQTLH